MASSNLEAEVAAPAETISEVLGALQVALCDPPSANQDHLRSSTAKRLLDLLRQDVVQEWSRRSDRVTVEQVIDTLKAFENVRGLRDSGWPETFAGHLSDPNGLALVVEMAHDLRSPLTSILFLAETLQKGQSGDVNELQTRQLGLIYSAALGLSTLASNVIELARGGSQLAEGDPSPFSVVELLESVEDIVQPMAVEKGLGVKLLPPSSDHRTGHPHPLSRVLLNLTTNAIKFTERGFVEIVAREKDPKGIEFSVRDTGPGINPQSLQTLYLPFRPARGASEYRFSGTGLGLELSRQLVEAMGSELRVETRPDWGTRFFFTLELPAAS